MELVTDLFDWLFSLGRLGGVILLALCGLCLYWMWSTVQLTGSFYVLAPALALVFGGTGLMLVVMGDPEQRTVRLGGARVLDAELLTAIHERPRPFHFCARCNVFSDIAMCDVCERTIDMVTVRNDRDHNTLMAALDVDEDGSLPS